MTDDAILAELGARVEQRRLAMQLTQAALAEQAGISKRTLERVEAGASAQMSSMVRILRVLDLLPGFESLLPATEQRPLDLLQRRGKPRQRARARAPQSGVAKPWRWDDDA